MNIVHVLLGKADPNTMNGVNKVVYNLAEHQTELGHHVTVCALSNSRKVRYAHRYDLKIFPVTRLRFTLSPELVSFLVSKGKDTVFHLHSVFIPEYYAITRVLIKNRKRYLISPHGAYNPLSLEKNNLIKRLYIALFEEKVLAGAFRIHAIGKSEIADIRRLSANRSIYLLRNGTDLPPIKSSLPGHKKKTTDPFVFCYCGRLEKNHKGLDLLFNAYRLFNKSSKIESRLWLIGDGPDRIFLERLAAQYGLTSQIVFYGTKFGKEKNNLIGQSDCFVHTSRWDVIPTAVLEAASLDRRLLVTKETNMGDFILKYRCGIVSSCCYREIAAGMRAVVLNRDSFASSRQMIEKDFTWKNVSIRHTTYYYQ